MFVSQFWFKRKFNSNFCFNPYKLKEKRICKDDEVITVAAGFPTTVAPIMQIGAKPVFIDADPITGNADCNQLELA